MNSTQRKVLIVVVAIVGLMVLFPPFQINLARGISLDIGYGLIFAPPKDAYYVEQAPKIMFDRLFVQVAGAVLIGVVAFLLSDDKKG